MYCSTKKQGITKDKGTGTFLGGELWKLKVEEKAAMLKIGVV